MNQLIFLFVAFCFLTGCASQYRQNQNELLFEIHQEQIELQQLDTQYQQIANLPVNDMRVKQMLVINNQQVVLQNKIAQQKIDYQQNRLNRIDNFEIIKSMNSK